MSSYLRTTNNLAAQILAEAEGDESPKSDADVGQVIDTLINTSWGGSNEEQGKAVQLLKGLAFSDDPKANKFMQALDKFTSGLDSKQFTESRRLKRK